MNDVKVYVPVIASFNADGRIFPRDLIWEDGRKYQIDQVISITQAAAMNAGGRGDRYTIRINGQESYLFFERNASIKGNNIGRWFVERKYDPKKLF